MFCVTGYVSSTSTGGPMYIRMLPKVFYSLSMPYMVMDVV
jgi:hypothetical protein